MIRSLFEITLSVLLFQSGCPDICQEGKIYTVSEVNTKPAPEKGMNDFYDKWSKKVVYPENAIKKKIQGIVFIQFLVNEDGSLTDISVRSGIDDECDEAALTGFKEAKTTWRPGIKNNQAVKVKMVIPFAFRIIEKK